MAVYATITDKGIALLGKLLAAEGPLRITAAQLGDGKLPEGIPPSGMTALAHYVMDAGILEIKRRAAGEVVVVVQVLPSAVQSAFTATEAALLADDPEKGSVLFAFVSLHDDPIQLGPISGATGKSLKLNIPLILSGVAEITASFDPSGLVSREWAARQLQYKANGNPGTGDALNAEQLGGVAADGYSLHGHTHTTADLEGLDAQLAGKADKAMVDQHTAQLADLQAEVQTLRDATLNNMVNNVFVKSFDTLGSVSISRGIYDPAARKIYV